MSGQEIDAVCHGKERGVTEVEETALVGRGFMYYTLEPNRYALRT